MGGKDETEEGRKRTGAGSKARRAQKMKDRLAHIKNERNNTHSNDDEGVDMVCDGLTMAECDID